MDLVGFGKSDKPDIDYRIQLFVDQIKATLDERGIEKATLVGNSMGGLVALQFAYQHPDQVDKLVLVAPAFLFGLPEGINAEMLGRGAAPETKEQMTSYLGRIYHRTVTDQMIETELEYKKSIGDTKTIKSVAVSLDKKQDIFKAETIATITNPALVIHGASDGVVPFIASEKLVNLLPNAELVKFEQSGHWPQLEEADLFNRKVKDFVR